MALAGSAAIDAVAIEPASRVMQIDAARFCRGDSSAMDKPHALRRLAEWYRSLAQIGHPDEREWRLKLADYLDRRAEELERCAERE
jgi:hypothetical protein